MSTDASASPGIAARSPRKPYPKNRKQTYRKVDPDAIRRLADAGLGTVDIAQHQGVERTTVWRYLQQHRIEQKNIQTFKEHRADLLAGLQSDALSLQKRVLATFDDGVLQALKPGEKTGLLMALNATHGTTFDKERLERGESTQNISTISRMIDNRVSSAHKPGEAASKVGLLSEERNQSGGEAAPQ
jgi:hypothetical protein